jgi:hypothetical protein
MLAKAYIAGRRSFIRHTMFIITCASLGVVQP